MSTSAASEVTQPKAHLTARQKARKRAVDILFEAYLRERDVLVTLAERTHDAEPPVVSITDEIVRGVVTHGDSLDAAIGAALAPGWTLWRMPRVDRTIARIGAYELAHTETPRDVVISEAVRLAQALSTDDSPAFLNAVLARLGEEVPGR